MSHEVEQPRLSSLDDPTRRALFDYVTAQGCPVSRDSAAAAVGVDRSVAAYHLDRLVADGLVTPSYFRPHGRGGPGAGRPAKHYAPSGAEVVVSVPPRDYRLAAELLARAADADTSPNSPVRSALEAAARALGRELAEEDMADAARPGDDETTLRRALEGLGFRPYQDEEGVLRLRNCPFSRLAASHPGLTCGMNLALMAGLAEGAGADVRPALDSAVGDCCVVFGRADPA